MRKFNAIKNAVNFGKGKKQINKSDTAVVHLDEMVAINMQDGLTTESDQIADIGRVLSEMGKSFKERSYLLSVDEDFIPDVLSYYNHKS